MERQILIESIKNVKGKNVAYCAEDKCIYYSPNYTFDKKLKKDVIEDNLPDLHNAIKEFKENNPGKQVKIIRL